MAYKDKKKQRQAVREATRRYREHKQGITKPESDVIPCDTPDVIPVEPGQGVTMAEFHRKCAASSVMKERKDAIILAAFTSEQPAKAW